jgi:methyltransferase (TIGR00027 family)
MTPVASGIDLLGAHSLGGPMANPISRTAYYTLGVRAWDAGQAQPLCGDAFARTLMNDDAEALWAEFRHFARANPSNAMRHAIIDEQLRTELAEAPDTRIVVIGSGFDTRPFRLAGGAWVEVDEPELLSYKESRLPVASAPNPLTRLAIDFEHESLADKLAAFAGAARTCVVLEGVLMYLTHAQRAALIETLGSLFPRHVLYCDLMRQSFFEKYGRDIHERIVGLGTTFRDLSDEPERIFMDAGYTMKERTSIPLRTAERQGDRMTGFLVRWLLGTLRDGYCVVRFERG